MRTRPLSPHLQVYRLPAAAIISISHRALSIVFFCSAMILGIYSFFVLIGVSMDWVKWISFSWFGRIKTSIVLPVVAFYIAAEVRYIIWNCCNLGFSKTFVCVSNIAILAFTLITAFISHCYIWG